MMLAWGLILSVTVVSTTLLMIFGQYLAILTETQHYFNVNRTMILLLSNSFNIFYILISPFLFNSLNRHYFNYVLVSTAAIGIASIGRYYAGTDYVIALLMAAIIAIAHIPIISAPYGLLKLFPQWQRGYAASIPLFVPVLGMNFCIIYDMVYITEGSGILSTIQIEERIDNLNFIIMVVGLFSSILTILLLFRLKVQINQKDEYQQYETETRGFIEIIAAFSKGHSLAIKTLVCWGSIVGINWTYGALFGIIFDGQGLTEKDIALLGLAANLSTALFSNMGTFIKNRFNASNTAIIGMLNLSGFLAAILLQAFRYIDVSSLYMMIGLIVVLRAGFSSFVSLAFVEMEHSGIPSVIISTMFFWVANVVNLIGMQLIDLINIDISLALITLSTAICIYLASQSYIKIRAKDEISFD